MVVCRDDHERHLFDCGNVHSFVEGTGLHPAFTDARKADEVFLALKSLRQQRAHSHRNHRSEVTNHCELVLTRMTSMNVAVARSHRAEARPQLCAGYVDERFTE